MLFLALSNRLSLIRLKMMRLLEPTLRRKIGRSSTKRSRTSVPAGHHCTSTRSGGNRQARILAWPRHLRLGKENCRYSTYTNGMSAICVL